MQKILLMSKFDIHSLTISRYLELSGYPLISYILLNYPYLFHFMYFECAILQKIVLPR